ncbi:MAG: hypothetical protein IIB63_00475 [Proteobacteria bacterium]|nr:hypothetical protein [Pseudomonadota bacterium]
MAKTDTHKRGRKAPKGGQYTAKRVRIKDSDSGTRVVSGNKSLRKVRITTASAKAMDETEAMFSHALSRLAKK